MEIYTIGFTKKTAEQFFGILKKNGIRRLLDIRLKPSSQLAGFAKAGDLRYFLRELCDIEYVPVPLLAPTKEVLVAYRKKLIDWPAYETQFRALLVERKVEKMLDRKLFDVPAVLLCSEATPEHCHRRLVAEYLKEHWPHIEIAYIFEEVSVRIVVDHLTRMQHGYVCAAGIDVESKAHIRPELPMLRLPATLTATYGGPFDIATEIDLGPVSDIGSAPEVEGPHVRCRFARETARRSGRGVLAAARRRMFPRPAGHFRLRTCRQR